MDCGCGDGAGCVHRGNFRVSAATGNQEQLVFVGSQPGVAWTPVERDRILAYITVNNHGPRAVQVFWDGGPPPYKVPPSPTTPGPTSPNDQFAPLFPGNSLTLVVGRSLKIVYAPSVDPADVGDHAAGTACVTYCCPGPFVSPSVPPAPAAPARHAG